MQRRNHRDSTIKTRHRQSVVHLYSLLIAKDHFYSCIFSMVSSLYLPFSFPSARDLALRSRIFLRSLSSFSLVMTTCKGKKKMSWYQSSFSENCHQWTTRNAQCRNHKNPNEHQRRLQTTRRVTKAFHV